MSGPFTVACVQTTSSREIAENIEAAGALVRAAAKAGADFVLLPETVNLMESNGKLRTEKITKGDGDGGLSAYRDMASQAGIWLLAGSLVVMGEDEKAVNRSFLIGPDGAVQAQYDKIHMFDVDLGDGEVHKESNAYAAGSKAVTAVLPWGRLGMSVCYDLRFPNLYRGLAKGYYSGGEGVDFISVPAAFTRPTGKAHWHVLLRARAIENGCYVFAPAQCGEHENGRKTYGHSLIINPWGEILADGGEETGIITADIDPAEVTKARAMIPSLMHDRAFT
ncbi:MAG: carbon-nitrogen hydrolase family protein [Proteobacteria bacterium]|nr:carbon-nitrogen hydrolase family protein [Pseudomonadota bacterium]